MKIIFEGSKKEYSKKILTFGWWVFIGVIVFTLIMVWRTENVDPLITLITVLGGAVAVGEGFYYNKAKAENKIKLMKENKVEITGEHFKGDE